MTSASKSSVNDAVSGSLSKRDATSDDGRIDAQLAWLKEEIDVCMKNGMDRKGRGSAYVDALRASLAQWERLRER